ncbi:MAG: low molecular weight protein-tyrosine-phosphatase [Acidimicrobiales bacterium]
MPQSDLRVATICTGNICRSPMAEVVLQQLIAADPALAGHVRVTSAGTANWHVGDEMDPRARRALQRAGYTRAGSPALYASAAYLNDQDVVVVMTREHLATVRERLTNPGTEVLLWRQLIDPPKELDVADPYYGDDAEFDNCLGELADGADRLIELLRSRVLTPVDEPQ